MDEAWQDGTFRSRGDIGISIDSAALRYGHVVFDAARVVIESEGLAYMIGVDRHLERFRGSCRALGFPLRYTNAELKQAAVAVLRRNAPTALCGIRWFAWATASSFSATEEPSVCVFLVPLTGYAPRRPLRLGISPYRRSATADLPKHIKATAHYVFARWATLNGAPSAVDEWIFLNERGHVTESARASLLLLRDGTVVAPPTGEGVLPGVTRSLIRALAEGSLGMSWAEEAILPADLAGSDGALLCSSSLGVAPVASVDGAPLPQNALLRDLLKAYADATHGRLPGLGDWVQAVRLPVGAGASS